MELLRCKCGNKDGLEFETEPLKEESQLWFVRCLDCGSESARSAQWETAAAYWNEKQKENADDT